MKGLRMAKARRQTKPVRVDAGALYSPSAAAAAVHMHARTILRATNAGALPAHRPTPSRCFIRGVDLLAWLTGVPAVGTVARDRQQEGGASDEGRT
jgi:hypothetical protein